MKISVEFERDNSYHDKWYVSDSSSILVTGGDYLWGQQLRSFRHKQWTINEPY